MKIEKERNKHYNDKIFEKAITSLLLFHMSL